MSTRRRANPLEAAFTAVNKKFRTKILSTYTEIKKNLAEHRYETSGLNGGKFAETLLRFLQHELTGQHVPFTKKIPNFADECRKLIVLPNTTGNDSLRVVIPRAIVFLYTMRNKRGIGHVGGDVDANKSDAMTIARIADWVVCELIRIYHQMSLEEAEAIVDSLATRNIEDIWEVAGKKRVLRQDLDNKDKCLLLVYSETDAGVAVEDLCEWIKYSKLSMFKVRILEPLDRADMIEFDRDTDFVFISPIGVRRVEEDIIPREKGIQQ